MNAYHATPFLLTLLVSCVSQPAAQQPGEKVRIVVGKNFINLRAGHLGLSFQEATERDEHLTKDAPPTEQFWDPELAKQTAAVWRTLCHECHGGRRSIAEAATIAAPAPGWGEGQTNLFGRERPFEEAYTTIFKGGEDQKKMPAWGNKIAREQIWSLLYYIEYLSSDAGANVRLEKEE